MRLLCARKARLAAHSPERDKASLVDLHSRIYCPDEHVCRVKADCAREAEEPCAGGYKASAKTHEHDAQATTLSMQTFPYQESRQPEHQQPQQGFRVFSVSEAHARNAQRGITGERAPYDMMNMYPKYMSMGTFFVMSSFVAK